MILIKAHHKIEFPDKENAIRMMRTIESAARTCYKSEDKITDESYKPFVRKIVHVFKHESTIEHGAITVRFVTDRGVTHEMVRHRLAAFSQESTRYVDYSGSSKCGDCQFIIPLWLKDNLPEGQWFWDDEKLVLHDAAGAVHDTKSVPANEWLFAMQTAAKQYGVLRMQNWSPQQARSVLPNSTKTEIVVTANPREWRHILKMRTSPQAHPQIREVMIPVLAELTELMPELFDDIKVAT